MTLTSHAIAGAAAAELFPAHPVIAFLAAFASHFVLDSIPHRDYKLESYVEDPSHPDNVLRMNMILGPAFFRDFLKVALDCYLGLWLALIFFHATPQAAYLAVLGAAAGVLPDFLQFVFFKFKHEPLTSLERLHVRIQQHYFPIRSFRVSLFAQAALILLALGIMRYLGAF